MIGWYFDKSSVRWVEEDKCFVAILRQFKLEGPRAVAHAASYEIAPMREEFTHEVAFVKLDVVAKAEMTPTIKAPKKGKA